MSAPVCGECIKYVPDLRHCVAGYCIPKNRYTYYFGDPCGDFIHRTRENLVRVLNEKGLLYCFECREAILNPDALEMHINHIVAGDVYVTEDVVEELRCAD